MVNAARQTRGRAGQRTNATLHSAPMRSVIDPLYVPAVALESAADRRTTIRLALVAGPLLQVCCVAVLVWPVSGTLGLSTAPELCPAELAHCTSNGRASVPELAWNAPAGPVPVAVTL